MPQHKLHHVTDSKLDKTNYRTITILPAFSKVFERVIHIQMSESFESIFQNYMFAYRKHHSCARALLILTEQWKANLDKHKTIAAVAMNIKVKNLRLYTHDLILEKRVPWNGQDVLGAHSSYLYNYPFLARKTK